MTNQQSSIKHKKLPVAVQRKDPELREGTAFSLRESCFIAQKPQLQLKVKIIPVLGSTVRELFENALSITAVT